MCPTAPLVVTMILALFGLSILGILIITPQPCAGEETPCPDGRLCPAHWLCCEQGCCAPSSAPPGLLAPRDPYAWYTQWPVLFLLGTLGGILVCCIWCLCFKRERFREQESSLYMCSFSCCDRRRHSDHDSAGSIYPPPRYSRCSSFHQAPPPYSEVTSKPDLYPLVITCGDGDGKGGGNYLMVHYFRNYVIREPGSLSAASTAESLNSSFICNAANEANSIVPPPYSNYEEIASGGQERPLPRSLSSLTEPRPRPSRSRTAPEQPRRRRETTEEFRDHFLSSPDSSLDLDYPDLEPRKYRIPHVGLSPSDPRFDINDVSLDNCRYIMPSPEPERCKSPPQPTCPTQPTQRLSEERRHRRDNAKKTLKVRQSSLYMPLGVYPGRASRITPGARASSRSAPSTPCGPLMPNLNFTQRLSASRQGSRSARLDEESDHLLLDMEPRPDYIY